MWSVSGSLRLITMLAKLSRLPRPEGLFPDSWRCRSLLQAPYLLRHTSRVGAFCVKYVVTGQYHFQMSVDKVCNHFKKLESWTVGEEEGNICVSHSDKLKFTVSNLQISPDASSFCTACKILSVQTQCKIDILILFYFSGKNFGNTG